MVTSEHFWVLSMLYIQGKREKSEYFFSCCVRFTQYSLSIISKNLTNEGTTKNKTQNKRRKTQIK